MTPISRAEIALGLAAILGGCNASFVPNQAASPAQVILPNGESDALLYLSDVATNRVYVYSYPTGTLVSTLANLARPRSECADAAGDVWIVDVQAEQVVEYTHGASKPIAAISTFGPPRGCSVDPDGSSIAVSGGLNGTVASIYHHGKRGWNDYQRYTDAAIGAANFCGFDATGDLFVDGTSNKDGTFRLGELPRGAHALRNVAVTQNISAPGQVQWDGKHLAIGDAGASPSVVYQFSISGKSATKVGSTILGGSKSVRQFWIQGNRLIGPDFDSLVGLWKYPTGGASIKKFGSLHGYGAAVSLP